MPDCHKCPVEATKDKLCAQCRNTMCVLCKGPSENPHNDGQVFVDIDSIQVAEQIEALTDCDREALLDVMRVWLRLPATTRDAMALRMCNPEISDAEVGRALAISRSGVGIAVRRAEGRMVANDELTLGL